MPKTANQKTRILELYRILLRESDEEHPLTVAELLARLDALGMRANRKTVMDDLHALESAGVDLLSQRGNGGGYFIGARDFELAELKMLVDAVQSSRFISHKKSESLISRLLSRTSRYEEQNLKRTVYVSGRVKSENVEVFRTVDTIHSAIRASHRITFRYYDWDAERRLVARHGGQLYEVTPYLLSWDSEYYYLLAYDARVGELRHYRVDKMRSIRELGLPREGEALAAPVLADPASYENELFGKFRGEECDVLLRVDSSLAGVIVDRFGAVSFISDGKGASTFRVLVRVSVSPVFLSWVMQFGARMTVLSPEPVREQMCELAETALRTHRGEHENRE